MIENHTAGLREGRLVIPKEGCPRVEVPTEPPVIRSRLAADGTARVELSGHWNLRSTRELTGILLRELAKSSQDSAHWDLTGIDDLDVAGATLLWHAWSGRKPAALALRPEDEGIFKLFVNLPEDAARAAVAADVLNPLLGLGHAAESFASHAFGMLNLLGEVALSFAAALMRPAEIPWRQISAVVYRSGLTSLGITALVGFLIGIVLSYLSAEQLHQLGADSLIVNLMGFAALRELGPLLAAILNAGRSGSSMTAQLGLMRVTSELEAMSVLGISPTDRLVLPRVLGQCVALPLIVVWTDVLALLGGMFGAKLQLGLAYQSFLHRLPQVVPLTDLWFGVCKGAVFGGLIALVACYFGLRIRPDTEGLAAGTTQSVVTALTLILVADAIFAVMFSHVGL